MAAILEAVRKELPDMPLILGGDLNTNTFDGRPRRTSAPSRPIPLCAAAA